MRVAKDRDIQKLGLSNKVKRQYKDRESIKDNTLFSFSNMYDCYKYIKDNIPGFADLFYSEKYDFNLSRSIKIIQIVCRANANISIAITQDPCEENDKLYICAGNNERQMFKYMSKHCPEAVIENTAIRSAAKYYYGNTEDDCHSISSTLLDVIISYLKKASSRKYPEHLRAPESMFRGVLESKQEAYPDIQLIEHKVNEPSNLGLNNKVKKKFDKVDVVDNASQIYFEDPEVERICHEHEVFTYGDAREVSSLGEWFMGNNTIETFNELRFFSGINEIEDYVFSWCRSLKSVIIPDNISSIGENAFGFCSSLQLVSIPDSVASIGASAFYHCDSLLSISIPDSVASIEDFAFSGCKALKTINIPDSVKRIGRGLFRGCRDLKTIYISKESSIYANIEMVYPDIKLVDPSKVNESYALGLNKHVKKTFNDTDAIVNVSQIPFEDPEVEKICHDHGVYTVDDATRVTSVDEWFSGNSDIKTFNEFKYFTGIETIYQDFDKCTSLQSINIPNSVTSIGTSAFGFCESLRSIDIPNGVTYIGYYSFYRCTSLQSVTIPNTVTTIRSNAFHGCTSLQSINISKDSLVYDQIKKQFPDTQLIEPNQKLLKRAGLVESVVRENKETNITNSQGQDVPELGKHAENVYLPDCPFMIGKDQVDWFEYFQREKEKHTIKDVDDFVQSAKKETKLIKESCKQKVNALEWFVALKAKIARAKESKKGQSL